MVEIEAAAAWREYSGCVFGFIPQDIRMPPTGLLRFPCPFLLPNHITLPISSSNSDLLSKFWTPYITVVNTVTSSVSDFNGANKQWCNPIKTRKLVRNAFDAPRTTQPSNSASHLILITFDYFVVSHVYTNRHLCRVQHLTSPCHRHLPHHLVQADCHLRRTMAALPRHKRRRKKISPWPPIFSRELNKLIRDKLSCGPSCHLFDRVGDSVCTI